MPKPRVDRAVLRLLAVAGLAAGAAALAAFTTPSPEVISAQRVDLVNPQGEPQATLSADSTGILLVLLDAKGRAAASVRLNDAPRLSVRDDAGREVARLGAPRADNLTK
jgi:hypothetical protein